MKRTILVLSVLLMILFTSINFAESVVPGIQTTRPDMTVTTPKGPVTVTKINHLYVDNKFIFDLNTLTSNFNDGTKGPAMKLFTASDLSYIPQRESVLIFGSSLDTSFTPMDRFKDTMTYIGKNYVIIMEYSFKTKDIIFRQSLPGSGVYTAEYDTDWYEVEDEFRPIKTYDWSRWTVQPKSFKSSDGVSSWLLLQVAFTSEERKKNSKLPSDELLMQIYRMDRKTLTLRSYLYIEPGIFYEDIQRTNGVDEKYDAFVFNPAGVFIQESSQGYVQIINLRNDLGICLEFDLSQYSKPKYLKIYWR